VPGRAVDFITPARRLAALALVRSGDLVPLGLDMVPRAGGSVTRHGVEQRGNVRRDAVTIAPHGFDVTHVDAWSHIVADDGWPADAVGGARPADAAGGAWPADAAGEAETDARLGVHRLAGGVLTRGILLDVATANGVPALPPEFVITPGELDRAVGRDSAPAPGCAVFLRAGTRAVPGGPGEPRPGLRTDCARWFARHQVAVYAGDCIDAAPADGRPQRYPLHAACLGELGLLWLDNPDMERLKEACDRHGRREFAIMIAPLPLVGMTGSVVNPLAMF
jgi:kynurenine formamidase